MARMLLSLEGVVIREIVLTKEYTTFGRRPYSDVVIDNLAVSGEHAAVRMQGGEVVVEDLQSTNGTFVNGERVRRHVLQPGDTVEIGRYQLKFQRPATAEMSQESNARPQEEALYASGPAFGPDSELPPSSFPDTALPTDMQMARPAVITVLSGAAAGRKVELVKVVTTIGKSGIGIASITRRPQGFSLAHVEGAAQPTVNGEAVGTSPILLRNGDLVELAGIRMQFASAPAA